MCACVRGCIYVYVLIFMFAVPLIDEGRSLGLVYFPHVMQQFMCVWVRVCGVCVMCVCVQVSVFE